jgi:hypothetical protein
MRTVLDIGEMGYSLYHYFHLNWRKEQGGDPPDVQVFTLPERVRVYEGELARIVRTDLPDSILDDSLVRNSFLYNDGPIFVETMKLLGVDLNYVISPWKNLEWKDYKWYAKMMTIKPFKSYESEIKEYESKKNTIDKRKKNIVIFPRYKKGSNYMVFRNWSYERWIDLVDRIIQRTDFNIILCGKEGQSLSLQEYDGRTLDLIDEDPFAMTIAALNDENTILTACSQSFGGKLSLLQNVDTVMWGHQRYRHQTEENWSSNSNTVCQFIEDNDYVLRPEDIFGVIKEHLTMKGVMK